MQFQEHEMKFLSAIPALPVLDIDNAIVFYETRLGFKMRHHDSGFAILTRDAIEIHLWEANDPNIRGAETFIAGTASCRVRVEGLRALYDEYQRQNVIHPNGPLTDQPWGDSDFSVLDPDNNLIGFCEPTAELDAYRTT